MARITVFFHGTIREKAGKDRIQLKINSIKELFEELKKIFPDIYEDINYNRIICLVNGQNIENLKRKDTELEDFDLVSITLKDGGLIDFFPPDGGG